MRAPSTTTVNRPRPRPRTESPLLLLGDREKESVCGHRHKEEKEERCLPHGMAGRLLECWCVQVKRASVFSFLLAAATTTLADAKDYGVRPTQPRSRKPVIEKQREAISHSQLGRCLAQWCARRLQHKTRHKAQALCACQRRVTPPSSRIRRLLLGPRRARARKRVLRLPPCLGLGREILFRIRMMESIGRLTCFTS